MRVADGLLQPIAADDASAIVAQIAAEPALNGIVEIAGADRAPFAEIVARYLNSAGDARYYGGLVEEQSLVPLGDARIGRVSLDQWLAQAKRG